MPLALMLPLLALLGLVIGSFLNVVIHRVPEGISLTHPPSACPDCGHPVRPYDNVPVVSWLVLHGRCRDCDESIPLRYPAVELATAVLFVLAGWRFGDDVFLFVVLVLVAGGIALFVIDLDRQRLPFVITGVTAALVVVALVVDVTTGAGEVTAAAAGSLLVWVGLYGAVWLGTSGRGMGLGDVALAPLLGLALGWLGWGPSLVGLLGGFLFGAVVGVGLVLGGRAGRRTRLPHGTFMLSGAALGMFFGGPLWDGYLRLVGVS